MWRRRRIRSHQGFEGRINKEEGEECEECEKGEKGEEDERLRKEGIPKIEIKNTVEDEERLMTLMSQRPVRRAFHVWGAHAAERREAKESTLSCIECWRLARYRWSWIRLEEARFQAQVGV